MHGGKYTVQTDRQRLSSSVCHSPGGESLGRHGEELFRFCLGLVVRSFGPGREGISEISGGNGKLKTMITTLKSIMSFMSGEN